MNIVELFLSIPILLQLYANSYLEADLKSTALELDSELGVPPQNTYDFIVVGGGTAGCIIAARLSEVGKVLLIEAGGTPPPPVAVPYYHNYVILDPMINVFFRNVKFGNLSSHTYSGSYGNGRMLGGSGSHNDMIHGRGSPKDFDNWAAITGDYSWSYANVLRYFKKSENFIGHRYGNENFDDYYGTGGPITVDTHDTPLLPYWFDAGLELGFPIGDPSAFQVQSFAPQNKAIGGGLRQSSYTGYIKPTESTNNNLTIHRYSQANEILLNDANNKAYGVAYTRHQFPQYAYASKEIIISAGTFSSAMLLMKSGIGPRQQLTEAGIPVKVPMEAVGQNMHDHSAIILQPFSIVDGIVPRFYSNQTEKLITDYKNGEGLLSSMHAGPQAFYTSSKAAAGWPDLQIQIYPTIAKDDEPQRIRFDVILGRPKSSGRLTMNTTAYRAGVRDDTVLALADMNLLSHPDDIDAMIEGINFAFRIAEETAAFRSLGTTFLGTADGRCSSWAFRSEAYWRCVLTNGIFGWTHMTGTCAMGPGNGSGDTSVVDNLLRVRGVEGLRVADASVMPAEPNANINAPVIMIAEKVSDDIKREWYA